MASTPIPKKDRDDMVREACKQYICSESARDQVFKAYEAANASNNVDSFVQELVATIGTSPKMTVLYVTIGHALIPRLRKSYHAAIQAANMNVSDINLKAANPAPPAQLSVSRDKTTGKLPDHITSLAGSNEMHCKLRNKIETTGNICIFLSSPFVGMEEERAFFVERYLPMLRTQCESKAISLSVVDLRWGITEEQAAQFQTLKICLTEIDNCDIFVGCYGNRYGTRHNENCELTHWVGTSFEAALPFYPWLEKHKNKGITELEFRHGILNDPAIRPGLFLFRDPAFDESKIVEAGDDAKEIAKYANLQPDDVKFRAQLEDSVRSLAWDRPDLSLTAAQYDTPETAAKMMYDILKQTLEKVLPEEAMTLDPDTQVHTSFATTRQRFYVGNRNLIQQLMLHTEQQTVPPVVVEGESGSGKSALLANWIQQYKSRFPHHPLFAHFTGCNSASTQIRNLLMRLLNFCDDEAAATGAICSMSSQTMYETLPDALHKVAERGRKFSARVIIVLDALNQLENESFPWLPNRHVHMLDWLPDMPDNIVLVCSTLPGMCEDVLRKRRFSNIKTQPLLMQDCRTFIETCLKHDSKTMTEKQMSIILKSPMCGNPLFLSLLIEELVSFGNFSVLESKIAELAACSSIPVLLQAILSRLESSFAVVGANTCVGRIFRLIGVSRHGVMERELQAACGVLSNNNHLLCSRRQTCESISTVGNSESNFSQLLSPPVGLNVEPMDCTSTMSGFMWSSLYYAIRHLLVVKSGRFTFLHDYIRQAVETRYLNDDNDRMEAHTTLAYVLYQQGLFLDRQKETVNARFVGELAYHLTKSKQSEVCANLLSNLYFVEAKCASGLIYDLLDDFTSCGSLLMKNSRLSEDAMTRFNELKRMLAFNLPILSRLPDTLLSVAINERDSSPICQQAQLLMQKRQLPHFVWVNKQQEKSPCMMHIEGHTAPVLCVSVNGKRVASGSRDGQVRIWDITTGYLLTLITAHENSVNDIVWQSEDEIISCSDDGLVSTWQIDTTACTAIRRADAGAVQSLQLASTHQLLLSAHTFTNQQLSQNADTSQSGIVCLWSLTSCDMLTKVQIPEASPICLSLSPDLSKLLIDESGSLLKTDSRYSIYSLRVSPTPELVGRKVIAIVPGIHGSFTARERSERLRSCCFSPCGKSIVTIQPTTLVKYTIDKGNFLESNRSSNDIHESTILSVAYGRTAIASGGMDKLVVIWNTDLTLRSCLVGHAWRVFSVAFALHHQCFSEEEEEEEQQQQQHFLSSSASDSYIHEMVVSAAGIWDKRIMVWEVSQQHTSESQNSLVDSRPPHFGEIVMGGCFTPDLKYYISSGQNGHCSLQFWDVSNANRKSIICHQARHGTTSYNGSLGLVPAAIGDGHVVATSRSRTTAIFSNEDAKLQSEKALKWKINSPPPHLMHLIGISCSGDIIPLPGCKYYLFCDRSSTSIISKNKTEKPFVIPKLKCRVAALSPSGLRLAVAQQSSVQVWGIKPPRLIHALEGIKKEKSKYYAVAYSPNGKLIAGANSNYALTIWCALTYRILHEVYMWDRAYRCEFTQDAKMVLCGGDDKTIGLWDTQTGNNIAHIYVGAGVGTVSSGLNHRIVAGDDLGRVNFFDLKFCDLDVPVATASYEWNDDLNTWYEEPQVRCPYSGKLFPVPDSCRSAMMKRTQVSDCPSVIASETSFLNCALVISSPYFSNDSKKIRLNPFIADLRSLEYSAADAAYTLKQSLPASMLQQNLVCVMFDHSSFANTFRWLRTDEVMLQHGKLNSEKGLQLPQDTFVIAFFQHYAPMWPARTTEDRNAQQIYLNYDDGDRGYQDWDKIILPIAPTKHTWRKHSECWAMPEGVSDSYFHGQIIDFHVAGDTVKGRTHVPEKLTLTKMTFGDGTIRSRTGTTFGKMGMVRQNIAKFIKRAAGSTSSPYNLRRKLEEEERSTASIEGWKVVIYTTSLGPSDLSCEKCQTVLKAFSDASLQYEERDIVAAPTFVKELMARMPGSTPPQVFLNGKHLGSVEVILGLCDSGQLAEVVKSANSN